jgi:hypothetical protein
MGTSSDREWLAWQIVEFLDVLIGCLDGTSFADDRPGYARNIVEGTRWITAMHRGASAEDIARHILAPVTAKGILDEFHSGRWGDAESEAFGRLCEAVRTRFQGGPPLPGGAGGAI